MPIESFKKVEDINFTMVEVPDKFIKVYADGVLFYEDGSALYIGEWASEAIFNIAIESYLRKLRMDAIANEFWGTV